MVVGIFAVHRLNAHRGKGVATVPSRASISGGSGESAASEEADQNLETNIPRAEFVYPLGNVRDPFQQAPAVIKSPRNTIKQPLITLTGIVWDGEDPIAIVTDSEGNSHLARIGEGISGVRIVGIRQRSVTIETSSQTWELVLWPADL